MFHRKKTRIHFRKPNIKFPKIDISKIRKYNIPVIVALITGCVLTASFFMHIISSNHATEANADTIKENIEKINSFDFSDVKSVEDKLTALKEKETAGSSSDDEFDYRSIFSDCMVVGDSITEGLYAYGFLGTDQVIADIGSSIIAGSAPFDTAAGTYPKAVFFAFGMNDMGNYSGDAEKFITDYTELLSSFKKKSPDTKVYICSISRPSDGAIGENPILANYKPFNTKIQEMCKKKKFVYIDTIPLLDGHDELYAGDGIHLSPSYYTLWLDLMKKKAGL